MKTKRTSLLILMICIGLSGCGSTESEDTQVVPVSVNTEQTDDAEKTTEESSSGAAESDTENENAAADNESYISAKTDSSEQMNADISETDEETEEMNLPDYEVTALEEPAVMYASVSLNVRQGPSTDFEIVGSLKPGQEVTVIGQADTGWYEILYNEEEAFVSNEYLQDEKPAETVADIILVGDSRFVQMKKSVGENSCTWIAESSKGYKWLNENAIAKIDTCVGNGSRILINLGVNDPGNVQNYLTLVNAKAEEWTSKGATVYYASVNPVVDNSNVTEEQVEYFNSRLKSGLSSNVHWIDSHSYLNSIGYKLVDGLHYNSETYRNLYAYYMSCI